MEIKLIRFCAQTDKGPKILRRETAVQAAKDLAVKGYIVRSIQPETEEQSAKRIGFPV